MQSHHHLCIVNGIHNQNLMNEKLIGRQVANLYPKLTKDARTVVIESKEIKSTKKGGLKTFLEKFYKNVDSPHVALFMDFNQCFSGYDVTAIASLLPILKTLLKKRFEKELAGEEPQIDIYLFGSGGSPYPVIAPNSDAEFKEEWATKFEIGLECLSEPVTIELERTEDIKKEIQLLTLLAGLIDKEGLESFSRVEDDILSSEIDNLFVKLELSMPRHDVAFKYSELGVKDFNHKPAPLSPRYLEEGPTSAMGVHTHFKPVPFRTAQSGSEPSPTIEGALDGVGLGDIGSPLSARSTPVSLPNTPASISSVSSASVTPVPPSPLSARSTPGSRPKSLTMTRSGSRGRGGRGRGTRQVASTRAADRKVLPFSPSPRQTTSLESSRTASPLLAPSFFRQAPDSAIPVPARPASLLPGADSATLLQLKS